jgi:hypothetical protein
VIKTAVIARWSVFEDQQPPGDIVSRPAVYLLMIGTIQLAALILFEEVSVVVEHDVRQVTGAGVTAADAEAEAA